MIVCQEESSHDIVGLTWTMIVMLTEMRTHTEQSRNVG